MRLVYDTGNPVFTDDRGKPKPYPKQSSWEFYKNVREFISYVHIKDGYWDAKENKQVFTFPGQGQGDVWRIVEDLVKTGYDGGFSIEPHLAVVYHDASIKSDAEIMYQNYVEYGRQFSRQLTAIRDKFSTNSER
jgi:sugar phosphate isomerase/epimerase